MFNDSGKWHMQTLNRQDQTCLHWSATVVEQYGISFDNQTVVTLVTTVTVVTVVTVVAVDRKYMYATLGNSLYQQKAVFGIWYAMGLCCVALFSWFLIKLNILQFFACFFLSQLFLYCFVAVFSLLVFLVFIGLSWLFLVSLCFIGIGQLVYLPGQRVQTLQPGK